MPPFISIYFIRRCKEEKVINYQRKPKRVNIPVEFPKGINRETTIGEVNEVADVSSLHVTVDVYSNSVSFLPVRAAE